MARVLVIDSLDGEQVRDELEARKHSTRLVGTGAEAIEALRAFLFDLVVMDHQLPDMSGLMLMPAMWPLPLIVLSAADDKQTRVMALRAGADDFVAKPWDPNELLERVAAVLRRSVLHQPDGPDPPVVGDLVITYGSVLYKGVPLRLTPNEHAILSVLAIVPDRVVSYADVLAAVYGAADRGGWQSISVLVWRLRQKMRAAGMTNPMVCSVRGYGLSLSYAPVEPVPIV